MYNCGFENMVIEDTYRNSAFDGVLEPVIDWTSIQNICWVPISNEISQYPERYICFIENNDANVFYEGFERYAKYKYYNSVFVDDVPMILANALKIDLILIEKSIGSLVTFETVQSNCQDCKRTPLFLHKRPDHYNAVAPLSVEPLGQHGHAYVNDALNSDNLDDIPIFCYIIHHH